MKKIIYLLIISIFIVSVMGCNITLGTPNTDDGGGSGSSTFSIKSLSFTNNGDLPVKFGVKRTGTTVTSGTLSFPNLFLQNVPTGTTSFLLVLQDLDSSSWGHGIWVINGTTRTIIEEDGSIHSSNQLGASTHAVIADGTTIKAVEAYYAPTPPSGTHRYEFRIYATSATMSALETLATPFKKNGTNFLTGQYVDSSGAPADRLAAIDAALKASGKLIGSHASITGKYSNP